MFRNDLGIPEEDVEQMRFEGVRRIPICTKPKPKGTQTSRPRPIIAKFSFIKIQSTSII